MEASGSLKTSKYQNANKGKTNTDPWTTKDPWGGNAASIATIFGAEPTIQPLTGSPDSHVNPVYEVSTAATVAGGKGSRVDLAASVNTEDCGPSLKPIDHRADGQGLSTEISHYTSTSETSGPSQLPPHTTFGEMVSTELSAELSAELASERVTHVVVHQMDKDDDDGKVEEV